MARSGLRVPRESFDGEKIVSSYQSTLREIDAVTPSTQAETKEIEEIGLKAFAEKIRFDQDMLCLLQMIASSSQRADEATIMYFNLLALDERVCDLEDKFLPFLYEFFPNLSRIFSKEGVDTSLERFDSVKAKIEQSQSERLERVFGTTSETQRFFQPQVAPVAQVVTPESTRSTQQPRKKVKTISPVVLASDESSAPAVRFRSLSSTGGGH